MMEMEWDIFFRSYNEALADAFERAAAGIADESLLADPCFAASLQEMTAGSLRDWYDAPLGDDRSGPTPAEMIDSLTETGDAARVFREAAVRCDDGIPERLEAKIASFGSDAEEMLTEIAFGTDWETAGDGEGQPSGELLASSVALQSIGQMGALRLFETAAVRFAGTRRPADLIADALRDSAVSLGAEAVPILAGILNDVCGQPGDFMPTHESLMIALTAAGSAHRSDEAYACLRRCFRRMDRKILGAACLGDYGDPRSIAVLKHYLDRPDSRPDRPLFYEILSSIRRLGGEIDDIRDPFGDFSARR